MDYLQSTTNKIQDKASDAVKNEKLSLDITSLNQSLRTEHQKLDKWENSLGEAEYIFEKFVNNDETNSNPTKTLYNCAKVKNQRLVENYLFT